MPAFGLTRDVRQALRMIGRAPAFSAVAILTLAVGIGVNTAVFNVVNGVLLRPLPYPDADRITLIWMDNRRQSIREDITSYPTYRDWRDRSTSYAAMAAFTPSSFSLTGAGEPERLLGAVATASFFDVMGVQPHIGRVFTEANEEPGADAVVVLSYGLWQRRFGGAGDVLTRTITLNGRAREIIGVMPPALRWPEDAELWAPLAPSPELREARGAFWLPVIGRLKPRIPIEQAQTELSAISAGLEQEYESNRGFGAYVVSLEQQLVGHLRQPLIMLLAAVGFVLLIACANLANLLLGRTAARRKELAVRMALGAGRARLTRQIVAETLTLACIGGALGLLLAEWATGLFLALGGDSIPRAESIAMDWRVLGFALLLATTAALVSALLPALQASRAAMAEHLREGGRQGGGGASHRVRSSLVAIEIALALVLLTGAGLMVRTLWTMQGVDRGFRAAQIAMMTVSLPSTTYAGPSEVRGFYSRLLERVRTIPGVEAAATTTGVLQPIVANSGIFSIEGTPLPPPDERVEYPYENVSPGFFEMLGIDLVSGRTFTEGDDADAPRVVVINETLARTGWPDGDPIGRRIRSGGEASEAPWMTVIGVIRDVRRSELTRSVRPELYLSSLQVTPRTQTLLVRTSGEASGIVPVVRRELQALDPQLPLFNVTTLEGALAGTLSQPRFQAVLLGAFALMAMLLAAIGVYGVTAYAVSQRTQEVGIRMALGARRREVLRLILVQHLAPALAGVLVGLAGAIAFGRYIQSLLYGVEATDPLTFAATALLLLAVSAVACWIPARRATRVDPLVVLRLE